MVDGTEIDGVTVLWCPEHLWPAALEGESLATRRRIALERLAAIVAADTGLGVDVATRCAAEILGPVASA